jgi:hypothetical protein
MKLTKPATLGVSPQHVRQGCLSPGRWDCEFIDGQDFENRAQLRSFEGPAEILLDSHSGELAICTCEIQHEEMNNYTGFCSRALCAPEFLAPSIPARPSLTGPLLFDNFVASDPFVSNCDFVPTKFGGRDQTFEPNHFESSAPEK